MKWGLVASLVSALSLSGAAFGQGLVDPTRPPDAMAIQPSVGAEAASGRLESILLSPRRKIAVIDGTPVPLGGRIGDATLVSIAPTKVVLREGGMDRVLQLYPAVDKKTRNPGVRASGDGGGSP
jgi:MSHA biogenesis protein MshK